MINLLRNRLTLAATGFALGVIVFLASTFANHSESMFDNQNRLTLHGTVKSFLWANPHGFIILHVDPTDAAFPHQSGLWRIETASPHRLSNQGWTMHMIKSGDKISIEVSAALAKTRDAFARKLTLVNGKAVTGSEQ